MAKEARSVLLRYGSAIMLTALATILRQSLHQILGDKAPFAAFVVAASLTAWYGGLGPALLTTFAGLFMALYLWLPSPSLASLDTDMLLTTFPYLVICLSVSLLIEFMRRAQRRAEDNAAALNESRKLLSTTLGSIGDAVIATDVEGRVTFMNQVAELLTGWTRREAMGKPLDEIFLVVDEQSRQPVESPVSRALGAGLIVGLSNHTALIKRDGTEIPIDDSGAPIKDDRGKLLGAVLVFRDVTERRKAEDALRKSESQLRTVLNALPVGVWFTDADGRVVLSNPAGERIWGGIRNLGIAQYSEYKGWWADTGKRIAADEWGGVRALQKGETSLNEVIQIETLDGTYKTVMNSALPVRDESGHILGAVIVNEDISARREAEDALQVSRARLDLVLDTSNIGLWYCDLPFDDLNWDARVKAHFGLPPDAQVKVDTFYERLHPDDREPVREAIKRAIAEHSLYDVDYRIPSPDGSIRWVHSIGRTFYDNDGTPIRFDGITIDISERKRAEQERERLMAEVERQRTRLNNIIANVPGVVWEAWGKPDVASQQINFVSDYVESMLGYSIEEWEATPNFWLEIVHPEDREQAARRSAENFASGRGGQNQFRWMTKDGRPLWVESRDAVVCDEHGKPVGMRGVTMDISERKRAEAGRARFLAQQQAHAERLQKLAEAALAINSARSLDAVMQVITEQARAIIGAHQTLTRLTINQNGAHAINVVSRSDKDAAWRDTDEPMAGSDIATLVCESNQPVRLTQAELEAHPGWRDFNAAGQHPPLRGWLAAPLVGSDGRNLGLIQLADKVEGEFTPEDESIIVQLAQMASVALENQRLITAEQSARAVAETSEQQSRFLAEASAALAASLDYEVTLTNVARLAVPQLADWCAVHIAEDNKPFKQLAITHIDPAKRAWAEEFGRRYPPPPDAPIGVPNVMRTGQSEYYPEIDEALLIATVEDKEALRILLKAGMKSAMLVPLKVRNRTLGVISFVISESNRHYTESDLALAEDLARRAALAVDNAVLFMEAHRARAQAEEANRMKDEFLATVSHELRTPLNAIVGWSHMLRTRAFDEATTARALETIERNAKLQAQIVEDILDVSRIITGKLRLDVQPLDLAAIVDAALDSVRPAAEAKEIGLQAILDPRAGPAAGDANRLQQIVWNLLANAVKFTPRGGHIVVRLERADGHIEIIVSDSGQGIRADLLPFIFDRFRQGDSTSTRLHGGLGLGLAIVRHLVELHGGTVTAESPGEDRGATFTVRLPLIGLHSEARENERADSTAPSGQPLSGAPNLMGLKVLVVDDEPDTREMLRMIIEQFGAEVKLAASSSEALTAFQEWLPDVIVSDIEMPGEDGYQLMWQIRRLVPERGGRTPAVALTAYARSDDRMRALSAGYQMHMAKPADPVELAMVIASLAARSDSV